MYFDWNAEMIRMTGDKIDTICNHEKNYIPFYYIFGSVFVFQLPNTFRLEVCPCPTA